MAKRKANKCSPEASAIREAKEWGVPDWRDPEAYGDTTGWEFVRWRWEFNRRQDDYRKEAINLLEKRGDRIDHSHEWDAYHRKWGYSRVLDPRVSDYPDDELKTWGHHSIATMKSGPRQFLKVKDGEFAVLFKLNAPLSDQLKQATLAVHAAQTERFGQLLQNRHHQKKWLSYLRALDAERAGATFVEIAKLDSTTSQTHHAGRDRWEAAKDLRFNF